MITKASLFYFRCSFTYERKSEFDVVWNTSIQTMKFENNFNRTLKHCECSKIKKKLAEVLFEMSIMNWFAFQKLLYIESNLWSNARKKFSSYTCNDNLNSDMTEIKLLNLNSWFFNFFFHIYLNIETFHSNSHLLYLCLILLIHVISAQLLFS